MPVAPATPDSTQTQRVHMLLQSQYSSCAQCLSFASKCPNSPKIIFGCSYFLPTVHSEIMLIPEMVSRPQSSKAVLMMSLIWKYYADPVTVLPSKWLFSSRANGGLPIWSSRWRWNPMAARCL
ncbi:unnamed protein product [Oncorhynchus mykiss]|uniref:Uncharacterized protein n=2 Tax=Oncorhynchus mykiss TaxID=8022 RepID=A0A060WLV9_ONCMY|nr:unnamed protein product [Oncorhynchus mykiss]